MLPSLSLSRDQLTAKRKCIHASQDLRSFQTVANTQTAERGCCKEERINVFFFSSLAFFFFFTNNRCLCQTGHQTVFSRFPCSRERTVVFQLDSPLPSVPLCLYFSLLLFPYRLFQLFFDLPLPPFFFYHPLLSFSLVASSFVYLFLSFLISLSLSLSLCLSLSIPDCLSLLLSTFLLVFLILYVHAAFFLPPFIFSLLCQNQIQFISVILPLLTFKTYI